MTLLDYDENLDLIYRSAALHGLHGRTTRWIDSDGNVLAEPAALAEHRSRLKNGRCTPAEERMLASLQGRDCGVYRFTPCAPVVAARDRVPLADELEARRARIAELERVSTVVKTPRPGASAKPVTRVEVELDDSPLGLDSPELVIAHRARTTILDHLDSQCETGGGLFGDNAQRDQAPYVFAATHASHDGQPTSLRLDLDSIYDTDSAYRSENRRPGALGDWHSHTRSTTGRPSSVDLRGWAAETTAHGRDHYYGVIITPRFPEYSDGVKLSWARPMFHGWRITRSDRRLVCARTRIQWA